MMRKKPLYEHEMEGTLEHLETLDGKIGYALFVSEMIEHKIRTIDRKDIEDAEIVFDMLRTDIREVMKSLKAARKLHKAQQMIERLYADPNRPAKIQ